jgi:hypothetical protein
MTELLGASWCYCSAAWFGAAGVWGYRHEGSPSAGSVPRRVPEALSLNGLSVPAYVSVMGCDNTEIGRSHLIGLTSIGQHAWQLGWLAARILVEIAAGAPNPATTRKLDPALVLRRTTSQARSM